MKKIRIGNDFTFVWVVERGGQPEDLTNIQDVSLWLVFGNKLTVLTDYTIVGNVISIDLKPQITSVIGDYKLRLKYVVGDNTLQDSLRQCTLDVDAFTMVHLTAEADPDLTLTQTTEIAIGLKGEPFAYKDFTPQQIADLKAPATDAANKAAIDVSLLEDQVNQAEVIRNNNEQTRISNESTRIQTENARSQLEDGRVETEGLRVSAENNRASAEGLRNTAENNRSTAEGLRVNAEQSRVTVEGQRVAAENTRQTNETARGNNEAARVLLETDRTNAEVSRVTVEQNRVTAETERSNAEQTRNTAEGLRASAEQARSTAEGARAASEIVREDNEEERIANELARVAAGYITSPSAMQIVQLTQAQYDALPVKVATTIYLIVQA